MAQRDDDLDLGHLFRLLVVQTLQVAFGIAIGLGVLLLLGIVGILLTPVIVPVLLYRWVRQRRSDDRGLDP